MPITRSLIVRTRISSHSIPMKGRNTQAGKADCQCLFPDLLHLKRGIPEKKWQEAKAWADSRVAQEKYHTAVRRRCFRNRIQLR